MVHVPTRGDVPVRLGPSVQQVPDYGPSTMSRDPYTDPVRFELERERVLGTSWLLAGRSAQVAVEWRLDHVRGTWRDGGDHPSGRRFARRVPQRVPPPRHHDRDPSTQGCGARRFTCPYHGWVYDTTGKLVGVPEREDFSAEHLDGVRAPAVAVDEWGGWVWINLAGPDSGAIARTSGSGPRSWPTSAGSRWRT